MTQAEDPEIEEIDQRPIVFASIEDIELRSCSRCSCNGPKVQIGFSGGRYEGCCRRARRYPLAPFLWGHASARCFPGLMSWARELERPISP